MMDVSLVNMDFYDIDKMNSYPIDSDSFVFCVSPEHPLAREKELTVEMIKNEPIMMYNTDSVQTNTLMGLFERHGIKPNIIMHASQLHTIRQFIAQRLGGAFLYESVTGTVSITFSTKLLDAFPSALIFNVSSNKYTVFVIPSS